MNITDNNRTTDNRDLYDAISEYVDKTDFKLTKDIDGNIIIRKEGGSEKILISAVAESNKIIVTSVKGERADYEIAKKYETDALCGEVVFDDNDNMIGVIRKDKDTSKTYIEVNAKADVKAGDILRFKPNSSCEANKLYNINVSPIIMRLYAKNVVKVLNDNDKDITFTVCNSIISAKSYINSGNYDRIYTLSCEIASDSFQISEGCGIVYKEGSAVALPNIKNDYAKASKDKVYQNYFGQNSGLFEFAHIFGKGADVGGIAIPVKHKDTKCEVCDINDIKSAVNMTKRLIESR